MKVFTALYVGALLGAALAYGPALAQVAGVEPLFPFKGVLIITVAPALAAYIAGLFDGMRKHK